MPRQTSFLHPWAVAESEMPPREAHTSAVTMTLQLLYNIVPVSSEFMFQLIFLLFLLDTIVWWRCGGGARQASRN